MRLGLTTVSIASVAGSLALAACGSDSSSSKAGREKASPAVARKEVGATRAALNAALATYKGGDRTGAQEQVAEAYVSHFEEVEAPLASRNDALKEKLEHAISDELRASMKAGKPAAQVAAQVKAIVADLGKAEAALR